MSIFANRIKTIKLLMLRTTQFYCLILSDIAYRLLLHYTVCSSYTLDLPPQRLRVQCLLAAALTNLSQILLLCYVCHKLQ